MQRRAVVIGAGLGGIAAALRLRAQGWNVTVCEAGPTFGGKMNRWQREGFTFDTGPSLITMPWVFSNLFQAAGSRMEDHVELVPLQPLSEYVFPDGVRFRYTSTLPDWISTLGRIAPDDEDGFFRFLELGARIWEVSRQTFLKRTPYDLPRSSDWRLLRDFPLRGAWGNYNRTVERYFRSPYLRRLFQRYPTYVGSSPFASPATLLIIPYLEFAFGGWYVRGGLYRMIEALVKLAGLTAVDMHTNSKVERIERKGGRVTGVVLSSGKSIDADVVVMNGDAATTSALLGESAKPHPSRSMSGFVMLLGIDAELPDSQGHTIYFSDDYRMEFSQLFEDERFPDDPTVYVNIPSRLDRALTPGFGETLFIMANAPARSDQWSDAEIHTAKDRVWRRLRKSGFPDLSGSVRVQDTWTPRRIEERYLMPGGAIYGTDSHGWRNAFLRPRNQSRLCKGLYHVGGSTHPGGGTPTVLLSAEITCALIEKHERG